MSVAKSVFLFEIILFASTVGWAHGAELTKCGQGSANGQFECLDPQFKRELARKADAIQELKKRRSDVVVELDQIAAAETEYRENLCALIGALEDGEPRWRAVWSRQCELKELHRFNDSLSRYSK